MITTPVLSQRDPKWFDLPLGTDSGVTIGFDGCVETCLTALAGMADVSEVNKLMIANGAFVKGLVWWVKVPLALPNLKFNWRSWTYDNDAVKNWIYNKGFPVIVQVDATPIGGQGDHYVLYIGDQKCMDPWTGTIRPTSDFPNVKGYILYEVISQLTIEQKITEILQNSDSIDQKVLEIKALYA